jgi:hypothetical protein
LRISSIIPWQEISSKNADVSIHRSLRHSALQFPAEPDCRTVALRAGLEQIREKPTDLAVFRTAAFKKAVRMLRVGYGSLGSDRIAAHYGTMKHKLYARNAANGGKAKSHKTAFCREQGISARMFNAMAIDLQGLLDGTRELLDAERKDLFRAIGRQQRQLDECRKRLAEIVADRLRMSSATRGKAASVGFTRTRLRFHVRRESSREWNAGLPQMYQASALATVKYQADVRSRSALVEETPLGIHEYAAIEKKPTGQVGERFWPLPESDQRLSYLTMLHNAYSRAIVVAKSGILTQYNDQR